MQQRQGTMLEPEVARQITSQVKRRRGVKTSHRPKPNHKNKESQVLKNGKDRTKSQKKERESHRPKPKPQDSCNQRRPERPHESPQK